MKTNQVRRSISMLLVIAMLASFSAAAFAEEQETVEWPVEVEEVFAPAAEEIIVQEPATEPEPEAEPVEEPLEEPAVEPVDDPAEEPADEPGEEASEPAAEPAEDPSEEPGQQPANEPAPAAEGEEVAEPNSEPKPAFDETPAELLPAEQPEADEEEALDESALDAEDAEELAEEETNEAEEQAMSLEAAFGAEEDFIIDNGVLTRYNGNNADVVIPAGVTSIGDRAFYLNTTLISVIISEGVTSIGNSAFYGCENLKSVTIPTSMQSIKTQAFYLCNNLEQVRISNLASWCGIKFWSDSANPLCAYTNSTLYLNDEAVSDLIIPQGVTTITDYAFTYCQTLKSVTIPEGVISIEQAAFRGCENLKSVTIPASMQRIRSGAFNLCNNLEQVKISNLASWCEINFWSTASNPLYANTDSTLYVNDEAVKDLIIPHGVTTIKPYAFSGCTTLTSVSIPNSVTSIGDYAFSNCTGLSTVSIPNSVTSIGNYAFSGSRLKSVSIPDSVTSIGKGTFQYCQYLTTVSIPNSVTSIGDLAFQQCYDLTNVSIPDSVTSIGDSAFQDCHGLTTVSIPNSVTSIGNSAFSWCGNLTTVSISNSVTSIGNYVFSNCRNLQMITFYGSKNHWQKIGGEAANPDNKRVDFQGYDITLKYVSSGGSVQAPLSAPERQTVTLKIIAYRAMESLTVLQGTVSIPTTKVDDTTWTFSMPQGPVTVTAVFDYSPWMQVQEKLNQGGTVTLGNNYTASSSDSALVIPSDVTVRLDLNGHTLSRGLDSPVENGCVILNYGNLTITGSGTVTGGYNTGSGGAITNYGKLIIESGTFTGNKANEGGGIWNGGELRIYRGKITNNTAGSAGGGIYCGSDGTVYLSDNPMIIDNDNQNVYLQNNKKLNINWLDSSTRVGITLQNPPTTGNPVVITSKTSGDSLYPFTFPSDSDAYGPVRSAQKDIQMAVKHAVLFSNIENGTVTADKTPAIEGETVTLTVTPDDGYLLKELKVVSGGVTINNNCFIMGTTDVTITAIFLKIPEILALEQEYLALSNGDSEQISATIDPEEWKDMLQWSLEDENGNQPTSAAITVDASGKVTAKSAGSGTAWVVAQFKLGDTVLPKARCRIDVVAGKTSDHPIAAQAALNGVELAQASAVTELYQTEYTRIQVIPILAQNEVYALAASASSQPEVVPQPSPESGTGNAITAARFTDEATAERFALRVVDDRTLEIIPTNEALTGAMNVASSYSSEIAVTVDGTEFPTSTKLKLTVKKTLPKIKAAAVTLNSYLDGYDVQELSFSGGTVLTGNITVTAKPDWLKYENGTVSYIGSSQKAVKGTLNLKVQPEGWAVRLDVAVNVSAKSTAPKITFKPTSLTLKPGTVDTAQAAYTISPALFANESVSYHILENKQPVTGTPLSVIPENGVVTVSAASGDGKAHTYTVVLSVRGAESSFTVKTLEDKKAVTLKLAAKGNIDLLVPDSPVTITATTTNVRTENVAFTLKKITVAKGVDDLKDSFNISPNGNIITLTAKNGSTLTPGKYTVTVAADYGSGTVENTVDITIKQSAKAPAVSLTLKATGSIDVLRPGTAVTLTPTFKNAYNVALSPSDITVTRTLKTKVSEDVTSLFDVQVAAGQYIITAKAGAVLSHADKYTVKAVCGGVTSKDVVLKLVQGKATVSQSTKAVTLLKTDRYSRGQVLLYLTDPTIAGIKDVKIVSPMDKAKRPYFTLTDLGSGLYAVQFNESLLPADIAKLKAQTVKLQVFLQGNETDKPNATLSLKVNIA